MLLGIGAGIGKLILGTGIKRFTVLRGNADVANTIDFGSAYVVMAGAINANNRVATTLNTAARIQGGTVDYITNCSPMLTCFGSTDVGHNDTDVDVSFNKYAHPSSRMSMGMGI